eukprot:Sspe_Gene.26197::Locus_10743_Transcript_1_1_Confidence_1.000_Length_7503::g.26197::m.26197/K22128/PIEZO1_2, FAM38; piezo-type mechanosensitive ion channel component 1/2
MAASTEPSLAGTRQALDLTDDFFSYDPAFIPQPSEPSESSTVEPAPSQAATSSRTQPPPNQAIVAVFDIASNTLPVFLLAASLQWVNVIGAINITLSVVSLFTLKVTHCRYREMAQLHITPRLWLVVAILAVNTLAVLVHSAVAVADDISDDGWHHTLAGRLFGIDSVSPAGIAVHTTAALLAALSLYLHGVVLGGGTVERGGTMLGEKSIGDIAGEQSERTPTANPMEILRRFTMRILGERILSFLSLCVVATHPAPVNGPLLVFFVASTACWALDTPFAFHEMLALGRWYSACVLCVAQYASLVALEVSNDSGTDGKDTSLYLVWWDKKGASSSNTVGYLVLCYLLSGAFSFAHLISSPSTRIELITFFRTSSPPSSDRPRELGVNDLSEVALSLQADEVGDSHDMANGTSLSEGAPKLDFTPPPAVGGLMQYPVLSPSPMTEREEAAATGFVPQAHSEAVEPRSPEAEESEDDGEGAGSKRWSGLSTFVQRQRASIGNALRNFSTLEEQIELLWGLFFQRRRALLSVGGTALAVVSPSAVGVLWLSAVLLGLILPLAHFVYVSRTLLGLSMTHLVLLWLGALPFFFPDEEKTLTIIGILSRTSQTLASFLAGLTGLLAAACLRFRATHDSPSFLATHPEDVDVTSDADRPPYSYSSIPADHFTQSEGTLTPAVEGSQVYQSQQQQTSQTATLSWHRSDLTYRRIRMTLRSLLFRYFNVVSLGTLLLASVLAANVMHAVFLVFFIVFVTSPVVRKRHWIHLIYYAAMVLVVQYSCNVVLLFDTPQGNVYSIIGIALVHGHIWQLTPYFAIVAVFIAQHKIYRSLALEGSAPSQLVEATLSAGLTTFVLVAFLIVPLATPPSILAACYLFIFLVMLYFHTFLSHHHRAIRYMWIGAAATSLVVAALVYVYQVSHSALDQSISDFLQRTLGVSPRTFGLQYYSRTSHTGLLLGLLPWTASALLGVTMAKYYSNRELRRASKVVSGLKLFLRAYSTPLGIVSLLVAALATPSDTRDVTVISALYFTAAHVEAFAASWFLFVPLALSTLVLVVLYLYQFPLVADAMGHGDLPPYFGMRSLGSYPFFTLWPHLCVLFATLASARSSRFEVSAPPDIFSACGESSHGAHEPSAVWKVVSYALFTPRRAFGQFAYQLAVVSFMVNAATRVRTLSGIIYLILAALCMHLHRYHMGLARWCVVSGVLGTVIIFRFILLLRLPDRYLDHNGDFPFLPQHALGTRGEQGTWYEWVEVRPSQYTLLGDLVSLALAFFQLTVFRHMAHAVSERQPDSPLRGDETVPFLTRTRTYATLRQGRQKSLSELLSRVNKLRIQDLDTSLLRRLLPFPPGRRDFTKEPRSALDTVLLAVYLGSPFVILLFDFITAAIGVSGLEISLVTVAKVIVSVAFFHMGEGLVWKGNIAWKWFLRFLSLLLFLQAAYYIPSVQCSSRVSSPWHFVGIGPLRVSELHGNCTAGYSWDEARVNRQSQDWHFTQVLFILAYLQSIFYSRSDYIFVLHHLHAILVKAKQRGEEWMRRREDSIAEAKQRDAKERSRRATVLRGIKDIRKGFAPHLPKHTTPPPLGVAPLTTYSIADVIDDQPLEEGDERSPSNSGKVRWMVAGSEPLALLCYIAFLAIFLVNPCVVNAVPLFSALAYAMTMEPRPHKGYWTFCMLYAEALIVVKVLLKLIYCNKSKEQKLADMAPLFTLGQQCHSGFFEDFFILLVTLVLLLAYRSRLVATGLMHNTELRLTSLEKPALLPNFLWETWGNIQNWKGDKVGADWFLWQFVFELLFFVLLFFSYYSLAGQTSNLVDSLQRNMLPGGLAVLQLVIFLLMIADRVIYLYRSNTTKFVFQVVCTMGYIGIVSYWFALMWQKENMSTFRSSTLRRSSVIWVKSLFVVKCVCLFLGARQVRDGYPSYLRHDPIQGNHSTVAYILYTVFRAVPFVFEMRVILDWTFTSTTLKMYQWMKLEDLAHELYLVQCDRFDDRVIQKETGGKGKKYPAKWKCSGGIPVFLFMSLLLFFPLFFYSSYSPFIQSNYVVSAHATVDVEGVPLLYQSGGDFRGHTGVPFLVNTTVSSLFQKVYQSMQNYDLSGSGLILQLVTLQDNSESLWGATSAAISGVVSRLMSNSSVSFDISFEVAGAVDPAAAMEAFQRREIGTSPADLLLRKELSEVLNGTDDHSVFIPGLYNPVYSSRSKGLNSIGNVKVDCWLNLHNGKSLSGRFFSIDCLPLFCKSNPTATLANTAVWQEGDLTPEELQCMHTSRHPVCPDYDNHTTLSACQNASHTTPTPPYFLITSDEWANAGWFQSIGIVAVYTTFVLAIGRVMRFAFSNLALRIPVEDLEDPTILVNMVRYIHMARAGRELRLENDLYNELIRLYRNPALLVELTRVKR